MPIELNHTIVHARDPQASAQFMAELFGRPPPVRFGIFYGVELDNGVTLDFMRSDGPLKQGHYAFLVSEAEFDDIFARIEGRRLDYWADPHQRQPKRINRNDGGRGVYWLDPNGHVLEIITRPYGGAA